MADPMPCRRSESSRVTRAVNLKRAQPSEKIQKTKFDCIVEAHESTRPRMESVTRKNHEDHIAGTRQNSITHYNLVHKFILMPHVMQFPDVKAAGDKEWKKLETIPPWQLEKVRSKKEVIKEAQNNKKDSPLSFMDGHLSSEECGVGAIIPKVQRTSCASRRYCEG